MDGEVLEENETLAIEEFCAHGAQEGGHCRKREIGGRDGG